MKRIVFFCPKCDTEEYASIPTEITLTFSVRCEACNTIFIYTAGQTGETMLPHTKEWSEIMQEVDRLYWLNQTSEGRINCITDYIVRLQSAQQSVERTCH